MFPSIEGKAEIIQIHCLAAWDPMVFVGIRTIDPSKKNPNPGFADLLGLAIPCFVQRLACCTCFTNQLMVWLDLTSVKCATQHRNTCRGTAKT